MKTKIIKQEKNPFMEREEFILEITNKTSPTLDEVKAEIGKDTELTVVKKVNTNFGRQTFKVEAVVYDNAEAKEKVETIPQKVRKKMEADKKAEEEAKAKEEAAKAEEETKAAEAPAEEATPAEETPKEETKEAPKEAPVEETKEETPKEETKEEEKTE